MKHLNSSSVDFLSVYLTLPIFSGKSLVDIKGVDCSNKTRTEGKGKITDEAHLLIMEILRTFIYSLGHPYLIRLLT